MAVGLRKQVWIKKKLYSIILFMATRKKTISTLDESLENLAEVISEEIKGHPHTALDPFDVYADRVRLRVKGDLDKFRHKFARGYHILIEQIEKDPDQP